MRQTFESLDEKDGGNQVKQDDDVEAEIQGAGLAT
jgi:hypothetical protein